MKYIPGIPVLILNTRYCIGSYVTKRERPCSKKIAGIL